MKDAHARQDYECSRECANAAAQDTWNTTAASARDDVFAGAFLATVVAQDGARAAEIYRHNDSLTVYCRRDDVGLVLQGLIEGRPIERLPVWLDQDEADDAVRQEAVDAQNSYKYW